MAATNQRRSGFTLIELLAAMAVLMLLVAMLARVFGTSATAWRAGNKRIESNNSGRVALEFMARELAGLIVSPAGPNMRLDSDFDSYLGMESDVLSFVTLGHKARVSSTDASKFRDVQQVRYRVVPMVGLTNRYNLVRFVVENFDDGNNTNKFSSYWNPDWVEEFDNQQWEWGQVLAENVRNFEVFITPVGQSNPQEDYIYTAANPPAVIDIYLEVLAEEDSIKASLIPANNDVLSTLTRRYATRVFVQNRAGYSE